MTSITVVIPVYNRANLVGAAIDSVLNQKVPESWSVELVVVDDGSTDDLASAVRVYGERVMLVRQSNGGAASARNSGISAAKGDFIAWLDSDDVWLPGKLAAQIGFMQQFGYAASCTAYFLQRQRRPPIVSPRYATGSIGLSDLVWGCFVSPGSTLICTRETFAAVGPLDTGLQRLEDWDWLLRYGRSQQLGFLAEPLARIEVAPHNSSAKVLAAVDRLRSKYAATFTAREARCFAAALELENAAAYFRSGRPLAALPGVARSLLRVPFGNEGVAAVLHNHFAIPNS